MQPADAYDYLVEARRRVFDRMARLSQRQYTRVFPFGRRSIRATLLHVLDSEAWYARMLAGDPEPRRSPFTALRTAPFLPLREAWEHQARGTRDVLARAGDPDRWIDHVSVAGRVYTRRLRTTASGVVTQLLFHEVHHRAQIMMMLRRLGARLESIDYNLLRWTWYTTSKG